MRSKKNQYRRIAMALCGALLALLHGLVHIERADAASWYDANWRYRREITIDSSQVLGTSNLLNFPIVIDTTDANWRDIGSGGLVTQSDGGDIVFTSSDGTTKLDYEIESYKSATGELRAWVKIPVLSFDTDTTIFMYYGTLSSVSDQWNSSGVWSNNYTGVYHLSQDPQVGGSGQIFDATLNANHGTDNGGMNSADLVTGKINGSLQFDGVNDYIQTPVSLAGVDDFTLSAWIKNDVVAGEQHVIWQGQSEQDGWGGSSSTAGGRETTHEMHLSVNKYNNQNENISFFFGYEFGSTPAEILEIVGDFPQAQMQEWNYITVVMQDATTAPRAELFLNGQSVGTDTGTQINTSYWDTAIRFARPGTATPDRFFTGTLDETRISNTARPNDWIRTEYNNQNNPDGFYNISPQLPVNITPANGATNVSLLPTLFGSAFGDPDSGDLHQNSSWLQYSVDGSGNPIAEIYNSGTITDNLTELPSPTTLESGTRYAWSVAYQDAAGAWSQRSATSTFTTGSTGPACQFHGLDGYIWSSNIGWISLNCNNQPDVPVDYGIDVDFLALGATPLSGYAWSPNAGWLNFSPSGPYPGLPDASAVYTPNDGSLPPDIAGTVTGWAKFESLGDEGWLKLGPLSIGGQDYGVMVKTDNTLEGWSWNGGVDTDGDGLTNPPGYGWVKWRGATFGAGLLTYWFETLYGDIYSGGDINARFAPDAGRYSATYLIQANGTIDPVTIKSAAGTGVPYTSDAFDGIEIPDFANEYFGTLGYLDREGLIVGQYGQVTQLSGSRKINTSINPSFVLNKRVFYFTGNEVSMGGPITILKGTGTQSGAGIIVVDGDLVFDENVSYESGSLDASIRNLPSIAWIVRGDVIIKPDVTNVVGLIFSEGTITSQSTGDSSTDVPLVIEGMMIAREIQLQRLYVQTGGGVPAEQIVFDGRAIANPPPGTIDLVKSLPRFSDVVPE